MKKIIVCALAIFGLSGLAHANEAADYDLTTYSTANEFDVDSLQRYIYCGIGDYRRACRIAAQGGGRFRAVGCIGAVGEPAASQPIPQNIRFTYVYYGYQQYPRRPHNYVGRPVFFVREDSYDWACVYAAVVRVW